MARPHHQDDHKTLAEIKKLKAGQSNVTVDLTDMQNVIEDCHVLTDETEYADWLIQQGIDPNVPLPDDFNDADPIHKLQHQDTMSIEDLKPVMNEMDKEMATQENKKEDVEAKSKITDTKEEYLTNADYKKIREDYLGQFQSDLNSFIWSGSSEEETIACIESLRNILDIMGEQSKEKAQKEDSQNIHKNNKEDEKKKTVETDCKIEETQTKPKTQDTDKTDLNTQNKTEDLTGKTEEEQNEESVKGQKSDNAKIADKLESENQNKETVEKDIKQGTSGDNLDGVKHKDVKDELFDVNGNPKVDPNKVDSPDKAPEKSHEKDPIHKSEDTQPQAPKVSVNTPDIKGEETKKKVSFNIDSVALDGQDNGNITELDDSSVPDIEDKKDNCENDNIDDIEIPCSQMVHSDPYLKSSSSDDQGNGSNDSGVDDASNGDGDGSQYSYDTDIQDEDNLDTDSSGRTKSSELEDISKNWVDYKEGHMLER